MRGLPLRGWPANVVQPLVGRVERLIRSRSVAEFYIGRSSDLAATMSRHGCDAILELYQTSSPDNAMDVETALVDEFRAHRKCSNDAADSRGGVSEEYADSVYLAIWRRQRGES